jgi:DNA-binding MarR family transcriptional regulator
MAQPAPSRDETLTEHVGMLIVRCRKRLWSSAARRLESRGDSMQVWRILRHLANQPRGTQRDVAEALMLHPAGVSRFIDDLERRRIVRRVRDRGDRRKIWVELTPKGCALYRDMLPEVVAAMEDVLRPLSCAERKVLGSLLEKVLGSPAPGPAKAG